MPHKPKNLFAGNRHGVECHPRNLRPIEFNENEPVTKKDLAEFAAQLTTKMTSMEKRPVVIEEIAAELTTKLTAMEERLVRELWHAVDVVIEQIGAKIDAIAANPVGHRRSHRVHETALGQSASARVRPASAVTRRA